MFGNIEDFGYLCTRKTNMVPVVQLVRASDCGSECRRFESVRAPFQRHRRKAMSFFVRRAGTLQKKSCMLCTRRTFVCFRLTIHI